MMSKTAEISTQYIIKKVLPDYTKNFDTTLFNDRIAYLNQYESIFLLSIMELVSNDNSQLSISYNSIIERFNYNLLQYSINQFFDDNSILNIIKSLKRQYLITTSPIVLTPSLLNNISIELLIKDDFSNVKLIYHISKKLLQEKSTDLLPKSIAIIQRLLLCYQSSWKKSWSLDYLSQKKYQNLIYTAEEIYKVLLTLRRKGLVEMSPTFPVNELIIANNRKIMIKLSKIISDKNIAHFYYDYLSKLHSNAKKVHDRIIRQRILDLFLRHPYFGVSFDMVTKTINVDRVKLKSMFNGLRNYQIIRKIEKDSSYYKLIRDDDVDRF